MLTSPTTPQVIHDEDCDCEDCLMQLAENEAYDLMECQIKESLT